MRTSLPALWQGTCPTGRPLAPLPPPRAAVAASPAPKLADAPTRSVSAPAAPPASSTTPSLPRPPAEGRDMYAPPSFTALVNDATASLAAALEDGRKLVEVEFPALPGDKDGESEKRGGECAGTRLGGRTHSLPVRAS